jgi:hypothetical protein
MLAGEEPREEPRQINWGPRMLPPRNSGHEWNTGKWDSNENSSLHKGGTFNLPRAPPSPSHNAKKHEPQRRMMAQQMQPLATKSKLEMKKKKKFLYIP